MPRMSSKTERVVFLLSSDEKQMLLKLASRRGESAAVVIRDLIRSACDPDFYWKRRYSIDDGKRKNDADETL